MDASIQAQVINLLDELQAELGLTLIFVAHDLSVVRHISDEIMVMYMGGMMEKADADNLIEKPKHPYTKALLSSVPIPDPSLVISPEILKGDLPNPSDLPQGCLFQSRCPVREAKCVDVRPELRTKASRSFACHLIK